MGNLSCLPCSSEEDLARSSKISSFLVEYACIYKSVTNNSSGDLMLRVFKVKLPHIEIDFPYVVGTYVIY